MTHQLEEIESPLITVIIGNYNYAHFLGQAIKSVLNQTYKNFQLIVVDDGSTDHSREVISSFGDAVQPIFQENGGQGAAFNAGMKLARGEIICFLDSDDVYYPEKLEKVAAAFAEHPEWVQVSHSWISVNREGKPRGKGPEVMSQGDVTGLLLRYGRYALGVTSAIAYRRSVLEKVMPIPTKRYEFNGKIHTEGADTYLVCTVPFHGQVGSIQETLMSYRIHGDNVRAHTDNLPYLLKQHEDIVRFVNLAAEQTGRSERLSLDMDVDYCSLKSLESGGVSPLEVLRIARMSLQESLANKRSPRDMLERFLRRVLCASSPSIGYPILRMGLRGYVRSKLQFI